MNLLKLGVFLFFVIFSLFSVPNFPRAQTSPPIPQMKGLSEEGIRGLINGEGLGVARIAELNHFPGPRHVLDIADKLQLSDTQLKETRKVYAGMHKEAVRLGKMIIAREEELENSFARNDIDSNKWKTIVMEIARLEGELRVTHIRAHLAMKGILSPDQISNYDLLKGYGPGTREVSPHHH